MAGISDCLGKYWNLTIFNLSKYYLDKNVYQKFEDKVED